MTPQRYLKLNLILFPKRNQTREAIVAKHGAVGF